jgi:ABC-type phosphate transport system permease subunit
MKRLKNKNKGSSILWILFTAVLIILVLSYFGISIQAVAESSDAKENFSYVLLNGKKIWDDYLKRPAFGIWNFFLAGVGRLDNITNLELNPDLEAIEKESLSQ